MHIAQTFFHERWNDQVYQTLPYSLNTKQRTLNGQDPLLAQAFRNGYNGYKKSV